MTDRAFDRQRRSIRLPHYDYARCGAYFVTICVHNRIALFGRIVGSDVCLNEFGQLVCSEWQRTPVVRPNVELDEHVIMPNHLHGIVKIMQPGRGVLPYAHCGPGSPSQSLGAIVRGFKAATTKYINEIRQTPGARVWQRNYYEHVIRNEKELERIREYIANNPAQWALDRENPEAVVSQYAPTDGVEKIFGGIRP